MNQSQISLKLWHENWVESKNKSVELIFPTCFEVLNLGITFFKSRTLFPILHCVCYLISRSLAIFNSAFFKKLKTICTLKFKARLERKESYEKVIHAPYSNKRWCLQCKWYEVKMQVMTRLFDLIKFGHFVFLVPSSPILSLLVYLF